VAEVDHHEKWQRARLTIACVAREHLNGQEYELLSTKREIVMLEA